MRLTLVAFMSLVACQSAVAAVAGTAPSDQHLEERQNIIDFFSSLFDGEDPTPTPTPTTTTRTRSRDRNDATATTDTKTKPTNTRTSSTPKPTSIQSTSTESETSTITTPATVSTSTVVSTTSTSVPTNAVTSSPSPSPPPPPGNQSSVSPAGIAVAVILSLAIVGIIAWLIFRYHPKSREWWAARQERKYRERSYRDGIDGVAAAGLGRSMTKRQQLASFFTPKTARLGGGREIRRKSVNWGAPSSATSSTDPSMPPNMSQAPYGDHAHLRYGSDAGLIPSASPACSRVSSMTMSRSGSTHVPNTTPGQHGVPSMPPSPITGPANGTQPYVYSSFGPALSPIQPQPQPQVYPSPHPYTSSPIEKPLPAVKVNGTIVHELP